MSYIRGILISSCINITCVSGLAILIGYLGMFSMGHAAFLSFGAYTAAILTKYFQVPFVIALLAGGMVSAVMSLIIGLPTLRGKHSGDAFMIATLGFGEAVRVVMSNLKSSYTGGALGISNIPKFTSLPVALIVAAISVYMCYNYSKSQHGKILTAIRYHADATELNGVNIYKEKIKALMISAFFCGIGGGLMAHYYTYFVPNTFGTIMSTNLLTAVVLGGISSVSGPALGALVLTFAPELLRAATNWRLAMYGFVLILMMRLRPEGFLGNKELHTEIIKGVKYLRTKLLAQKQKINKGGN